jgi:hypothetical protein
MSCVQGSVQSNLENPSLIRYYVSQPPLFRSWFIFCIQVYFIYLLIYYFGSFSIVSLTLGTTDIRLACNQETIILQNNQPRFTTMSKPLSHNSMIIQKEQIDQDNRNHKTKKKYYHQYHLAIHNHHKLQKDKKEYTHKSRWVLFAPSWLPSMQCQSAYTN